MPSPPGAPRINKGHRKIDADHRPFAGAMDGPIGMFQINLKPCMPFAGERLLVAYRPSGRKLRQYFKRQIAVSPIDVEITVGREYARRSEQLCRDYQRGIG